MKIVKNVECGGGRKGAYLASNFGSMALLYSTDHVKKKPRCIYTKEHKNMNMMKGNFF